MSAQSHDDRIAAIQRERRREVKPFPEPLEKTFVAACESVGDDIEGPDAFEIAAALRPVVAEAIVYGLKAGQQQQLENEP